MYLDDADGGEPVLAVADLKLGATARGAVGLWVDIGTEGYFADLRVVHHRPGPSRRRRSA